jgi:UPF0042 nucleotide-binding protein
VSRVLSFSYKFGPEPKRTTGHTLWLDARCVTNPYRHGEPDETMRAGVLRDPGAQRLVERGVQYLTDVPDGVVFVGCSYGRHRSVAIADEIARRFGTDATHTSRGSNGKPS